jgi:hypothetical protein
VVGDSAKRVEQEAIDEPREPALVGADGWPALRVFERQTGVVDQDFGAIL